jgi:hypothetical protein
MDDSKLTYLKWDRLSQNHESKGKGSQDSSLPFLNRLKGRTLRFLEREAYRAQNMEEHFGPQSLIWSQRAPEEILKNLPDNRIERGHVLFMRLSRIFTAGLLFKKVSALHWVIERVFVDGRMIHFEEDETLRRLPEHKPGSVLVTHAPQISLMMDIQDIYPGDGASAYLVSLTHYHSVVVMSALPRNWLGDYLKVLSKHSLSR